MKRILFVDDEPLVLQGLQRMLYGMRSEWEMRFAGGGEQGLKMMAESPFDVVISDMRMPAMNGAEFLNLVMERYPRTVRFILSGYADAALTMQCVGGTHQFLSKPCDGETLRTTIRRAMEVDEWLRSQKIKALISRMNTLPSLPTLYFKILRELQSSEANLEGVGVTIAQDPAMTAKILQMVNSAFFGLRRQLADPTEAVIQLGLETIKSLVLALHVFSEFGAPRDGEFTIESLHNHSFLTGQMAKKIAQLEGQDKRQVDEAFTAGLLHDVGRLILLSNLPEDYDAAVTRAKELNLPLVKAEKGIFGASHSEAGGYLLGLWGLPVPIVEAAVFHHNPRACKNRGFTALTAVHVANVLAHESGNAPDYVRPELDQDYLAEIGVWNQIPLWREELAEVQPA